MLDSIKAWVKAHKTGIIVGGVIIVAGTTVVLLISGKRVTIHPEDLADKALSAIPNATKPIEPGVKSIEEVANFKTFARSGCIRQLHEGWKASREKIAQAAAMGIGLNPGETIVDACMVTARRVA